MGTWTGFAAIAVAWVLSACGGSSGSGPVTLNWYVFPEPSGSFATAAANCSKASGGKYQIRSTSSRPPRTSSESRSFAASPPETPRLTFLWLENEYRPVVQMLRDADLIGGGQTETEAYMRVTAERYWLLRTDRWDEEVIRRVTEGESRRGRRRR